MAKKKAKQPDIYIAHPNGPWIVVETKVAEPYSEQDATKIMTNYLDQIQEAVEASGVSQNQLARSTNMSQPTLSRFLKGETSMRFESVVLLLDRLGLEIRPKAKSGKAAGTRAAKTND